MPKKIFELAKELDMGPLDLVEELRKQGFAVRNHMTSLSDDEVTKAMGFLKPAKKEASDTSSSSKKTVTRKKATAKTVKKKEVKKEVEVSAVPAKDAPPSLAAALSEADAAVAPTEEDKSSKRPPAVIRRKTSSKDDKHDEHDEEGLSTSHESGDSAFANALQASMPSPPTSTDSTEESKAGERPTGLRVVSRPKPAAKTAASASTTAPATKKPTKDYYEEKVHRFTPVFIPEAKEGASGEEGDEYFDDDKNKGDRDDLESASGKKRLGGLASMMSGKKIPVGRSQMLSEVKADEELKSYSALSSLGRPIYSPVKKKKNYSGPTAQTELTQTKESKRVVGIHKACDAQELAQKLNVKFGEFADKALELNILLRENDLLGLTLASELAALYNYRAQDTSFDEQKALGKSEEAQDKEKLPARDPIITIMGHVDHGKTTLLDYIRKEKVAAGEAGGITQHIGAYSVKVKDKTLTFLDTPGHAAFANMRQRGANVTDIVVLVVAADDGVMPQTKESIGFCQQAGVPIIVAVNKMDKEGVNPDRIKTELTEFSITPEEWGGETIFVPISALKGTGVDDLLESIALQAEIMDLRADNKGAAEGVVIESKIEQGRGPVATILVQSGTLKKGDSLVVGESFGRARSLMNHAGKLLDKAGPAVPVQILGLDNVPNPGDMMNVVKNEREAKKIVDNRVQERKKNESAPSVKKMTLEDFFAGAQTSESSEAKVMNLIVRADVQGSYEAIKQSMESLSNPEVAVKVIGGGVGAITDSDVQLAASASAYVIGFGMRPATSARKLAEEKGVDIKNYSIIYELINDVKLAIEGMLTPEFAEEYIGRAEVREVFSIPKIGAIAGSAVIDGKMATGCKIRLLRNGKIVYDGQLSSLKRFKDDVKEVKNGLECGIALENYNDIKVGDIFEAYNMVERKRTLEEVEKAHREGQSSEARV